MYKTFIKKIKKHVVITAMLSVASLASFAQALEGGTTYPINGTESAPTSFASLSTAVAYLNTNGVTGTGQVILEFTTSGTEDLGGATLVIPSITGVSATSGITIRPATGITKIITGAVAGATSPVISITGSYITIDGRQGGTGAIGLTIRNTAAGPAVRFTTSGVLVSTPTYNTLTYTNLQADAPALSGIVFFAGYGANNTVSYNNIIGYTAAGANAGIVNISNVTANNSVLHNNISRFNTYGIRLSSGTNAGWVVSGNSIYTSEAPSAAISYGITVGTATGNITISNNFIGGNAPLAEGEMPMNNAFYGIYFTHSSVVVGNRTVTNNTIANIASATGALRGIFIYLPTGAGTDNTFNIYQNKIYNLRHTAGSGTIAGIYLYGNGTVGTSLTSNIVNNVISLINANIGNENVYGIFRYLGNNGGVDINNNAIPGDTDNIYFNTIHLSNATAGTGQHYNVAIESTNNTLNIKNNILSNAYASGAGYVIRILAANAVITRINNLIAAGYDMVVDDNELKFVYGTAGEPADFDAFFENAATVALMVKSAFYAKVAALGTPIAGFTTDIIGTLRDVAAPTIGAYEQDAETVLPVNIISFNAKLNSNKVQFNWAVGTETNVNRYEVERLQADGSYIKVAQVVATGVASYTATDAQPVLGVNYYRLKSVDNDGTIGYYAELKNVKVANLSDKSVSLYPNPVTGNTITVSLANYPAGQYSYKLVSVAGNVVQKGQFNNNGSNVVALPTALAKGVYVLNIVNGNNVVQSKLLKN